MILQDPSALPGMTPHRARSCDPRAGSPAGAMTRMVAVVACLVACANAQAPPPWRDHTAMMIPISGQAVGQSEVWLRRQDAAVRLTWAYFGPPAPVAGDWDRGEDLPFDVVGGVAPLGGLGDRLLVSGYSRAGTAGRICLVRLDGSEGRAVRIESRTDLPGRDPWEIAWNQSEGALYVADGLNGEILRAPWDGTTGPPQTFTVIATKTAVPALGYSSAPASIGLFSRSPQSGITLGHSAWWYDFELLSGAWQITLRTLGDTLPQAPVLHYSIQDPDFQNALGPLGLKGPAGPFQIIDAQSGDLAGSGLCPSPDQWLELSLATALAPGRTYFVRGPTGTLDSDPFTPLQRHGATAARDGVLLNRGIMKVGFNRVGDQLFSLGTDLRAIAPPAAFAYSTPVFLWLHLAVPGTPPPIAEIGGTIVLAAAGVLGPRTAAVSDLEPIAPIGMPVPIPDEPALGGMRLYAQFACFSPSGVAVLSDVFAMDIQEQSSNARASGGVTLSPHARRTAIRAFLDRIGASRDFTVLELMIQTLRR